MNSDVVIAVRAFVEPDEGRPSENDNATPVPATEARS